MIPVATLVPIQIANTIYLGDVILSAMKTMPYYKLDPRFTLDGSVRTRPAPKARRTMRRSIDMVAGIVRISL